MDVVLVLMRMFMFVVMGMIVIVRMFMFMLVIMIMREMNVEFHSRDGGFLLARNVEMVAFEFEFF